jgi:hypothetical protein
MPDHRDHPARSTGLRAREVWAACLAALLLAAVPLWPGLSAGAGAVTMAVDTATVGEPWNTVLEAEGAPTARPRNPELSDQGVAFYPFYRWVSRSWRAGDPPWWCPLIYCGAPALGDPQMGVLDPQVGLLVLAEALFGVDGFHAAIDLVAWARLALAGLGAYLLARRLGRSPAAAALAGVGFGLSGFLVLWLHHSLGHVTPWLPWVLFGLEGTRGPRPRAAALGVGLTMTLAVLGGHAETAFYVGAAAGLWALAILREDRRAGLLGLTGLALGSLAAAPVLLPFVEYLGLSAAQAVREASAGRQPMRWSGLAACALIAIGAWRVADPRAGRGALWVALVALGLAGLWRAGLPGTAGLTIVGDLFGRPGSDSPWIGRGSYVEEASGWLPAGVTMLAAAGALGAARRTRHGFLLASVGFVALALVLRAPGLLELKRQLPVIGLGATVRLAVVSSLFLSLLAAAALDDASRRPRVIASGLFAFCVWLGVPAGPPTLPESVRSFEPEADALVGFARVPSGSPVGEEVVLEGWAAPELAGLVERASVRVTAMGDDGELDLERRLDVPLELHPAPSPVVAGSEAARTAPPDALWFRTRYLQVNRLEPGLWAFDVELYGAAGAPLGARRAALSLVHRGQRVSRWSWLLLGLSGASLFLGRRGGWATTLVAAAHGLWFALPLNPAVPVAELFPETATERVVMREQGFHRYFADPATLWPDTGMVRGLRALDGYDGMDPADYNAYRLLALRPGQNALLAWNARGVDLDAPAFQQLGVGLLVLRGPLLHPDWELIAGPSPEHPEYAETWIYAARRRPARAFIATRAATPNEVASLPDWDPTEVVATLAEWRASDPARNTRAEVVDWSNNSVTIDVELDGDGFLVLTDQYFPGWSATVDGQPVQIERANGIFRGVPLVAGARRVEFRYRPW